MNAGTLHAVILKYSTQKGLHYALCKECGGLGDTPVSIAHKEDCAVFAMLSLVNRTEGNFLIEVENFVSEAILRKALQTLKTTELEELLRLSEGFITDRKGAREELGKWCAGEPALLPRWTEVRREDAMAFVRDVCLLKVLPLSVPVFQTLERGVVQRYRLAV